MGALAVVGLALVGLSVAVARNGAEAAPASKRTPGLICDRLHPAETGADPRRIPRSLHRRRLHDALRAWLRRAWGPADPAVRRQRRIEHPTAYTRGERYEREFGFEDPAIEVPVLLLGRRFDPGHGLPTARLEGGGAPLGTGDSASGQKLGVYCSHRIQLLSWTAAGWKRFSATRQGSEMRTWRCTQATEIPLANGHATVYAAYEKDFTTCPTTPPTRHFAVAEIGRAVIAVNFGACPECLPYEYRAPTTPPPG